MTYADLIQALNATGIPFTEAAWHDATKLKDDYGVYALDNRHDLMANNKHSERFVEGTIDLFAITSRGDHQAALIETALESVGAFWRLNYGPHYEQDTRYTHWEWVFDVLP